MKMRNILENKFWWAVRSFAAVVLFGVSTLSANIFITEIADPNNDGQHFEALVISPTFEGLSLVKQHQLVYSALKEELASEAIHALALKTETPN